MYVSTAFFSQKEASSRWCLFPHHVSVLAISSVGLFLTSQRRCGFFVVWTASSTSPFQSSRRCYGGRAVVVVTPPVVMRACDLLCQAHAGTGQTLVIMNESSPCRPSCRWSDTIDTHPCFLLPPSVVTVVVVVMTERRHGARLLLGLEATSDV